MKPFYQILDELSIAFQNVDQRTRDTVISHLFEQRAITGGLAVFRAGSKGLSEYADQVRNAGAATQNVADDILESFNEQMGITYQQLQAVSRRLGAGLAPAIMRTTEAMRPHLNALREWMDLNPQVVQSVTQLTAALVIGAVSVGGLGLGLKGIGIAIAPIISGLKVLGPIMTGLFGFWPIAIMATVAALYTLRAAWNQNAGAIRDRVASLIDFSKGALEGFYNVFLTSYWGQVVLGFTEMLKVIRDNWAWMFKTIVGIITANLQAALHIMQGYSKAYTEAMILKNPIAAAKTAYDTTRGISKAAGEGFLKGMENADLIFEGFKDGLFKPLKDIAFGLEVYGIATAENIGEVMGAVKTQFKQDLDALVDMLASKFPQYQSLLSKFKAEVEETVAASSGGPGRVYEPTDQLPDWKRGLQQYYTDIENWSTFVQESVKETAKGIEQSMAGAFATIGDQGKNFKNVVSGILKGIGEELRNLMGQMASRILMKATIEHVFPSLAGLAGGGEMTLAATTLQTAGNTLLTAAGVLQSAAATMSAGGAAGSGGGLAALLTSGSSGAAGGWAGMNSAPGMSTASATGTMVAHHGGRVGSSSFPTVNAPTSWFTNAPRFHDGLKLKSDEYPAILQKGEEVKSKDEVNKEPSIKQDKTNIINFVDKSLFEDYLRTSAGEKAILNVIRRNQ
jgi:hypothetical protein